MKEVKVIMEGFGIGIPETTPAQIRVVLLNQGQVIDMLVLQLNPPYEKLEILKGE